MHATRSFLSTPASSASWAASGNPSAGRQGAWQSSLPHQMLAESSRQTQVGISQLNVLCDRPMQKGVELFSYADAFPRS